MFTFGEFVATEPFPIRHVQKRAVGAAGIPEIEHYTAMVGLKVIFNGAKHRLEPGDLVYVPASEARGGYSEQVFRVAGEERDFILVPLDKVRLVYPQYRGAANVP